MKSILKLLPLCILAVPALVFAQAEYLPLVGIPGVSTDSSVNFDQYLQAVYATSISLAALLAVIKIVIAGVKWMTTDIVSSKSAAKSDIQGAVLGLVIILGAVLILYIINPNIGAVSLEFTPAPRPTVVERDPTLAPLENCTPETNCTRERCEAVTTGSLTIGDRTTTYDCTAVRDRCLGTFVAIESGSGIGRGTCTATTAEIEASLNTIAQNNCPDGRECRAEQCSSSNCESSCMARNAITYDSTTHSCVFFSDSYDVSTGVISDDSTTYTIRQNEDQIAAGETPTEITIISDTAENGFVTVAYEDGTQTDMSCSAIVPNPCVPLVTTAINIDTNGVYRSDNWSSDNIGIENVGEGETTRSTYHRVIDDIVSAGGSILSTNSSTQFGGDSGEQYRTEQACQANGGNRVTYLLQAGGVAYRSICSG